MTDHLKRQLEQLRTTDINPRDGWIQSNRALLLAQIKNTVPAVKAPPSGMAARLGKNWSRWSLRLPEPLFAAARPFIIILVVGAMAMSGWIQAVDAAYEALPGDLLYPAKRATEKTQVAVAGILGGDQAQTKLHAEFAKRRATETKKIIVQNDPKKLEKVVATVASLKDEINVINKKLEANKGASDNLSADTIKDVKQSAEQISAVLQDVKSTLVAASSTVEAKVISKEVQETKDLVKDVSVKAVEVIVNKHLEGDTSVSSDDVKKEINKTLQATATEAVEVKAQAAGVSTVLEAAKSEAKELAKEAKTQGGSLGAVTSTQNFAATVSAVAEQTKATAKDTAAASTAVDKKVSEAQGLLVSGDLTGAVDKLKEATEATRAVEKMSDTAFERIQTVLPIVQMVKDGALAEAKNQAAAVSLVTTTISGTSAVGTTTLFVAPSSSPVKK